MKKAKAASRNKTVGVIGLGIMGGSYARHLSAAGWRVVGFDTNPARGREAARAGVSILRDATEIAREAPVIITSLPSPAALDLTVGRIIAAGAPRRTVIEASTFTLEDKLAAAEKLKAA